MSSQDPNHPYPTDPQQQQGYGQSPAGGQQGNWQGQQGHGQPHPEYGSPQQNWGPPQGGPYGYHQQAVQRWGSQPGVSVGFGAAIKRFYSKYAQFSGRASRSEYWWVALYLGLIYFVLSLLVSAGTDSLGNTTGLGSMAAVLLGVFALGHIVPSIAIGVRRLHDINISGWLYLIVLLPYVGGLVLFVLSLLSPKPEGARFDR